MVFTTGLIGVITVCPRAKICSTQTVFFTESAIHYKYEKSLTLHWEL